MGCDMVVALGRATADTHTLFGHNSNRPGDEGQSLVRQPGRPYAPGEKVQTSRAVLDQARLTWTVLACRSGNEWGYRQGVNEHGVALGLTSIRTKVADERSGPSAPGLTGTDLVRLGLERAGTALQAVDVLTDLLGRHGQAGESEGDAGDTDSAFLIADGREAYVLETCGAHWAVQQVREVRAVSNVCHLRQDWDRISRGLADLAIGRGWWPDDGSKLDFAGALAREGEDNRAALRRWGRATLLLEQLNGQIDGPFVRRLLADHTPAGYEEEDDTALPPTATSLCRHPGAAEDCTSVSLLAQLGNPETPTVAWWCFGPPCVGLWFPLVPLGALPPDFQGEGPAGSPVWRRLLRWGSAAGRQPNRWPEVREALAGLQERFDQDTRELLAEAAVLRGRGASGPLQRLADSFMQHNLEAFLGVWEELFPREEGVEHSCTVYLP
jgi:secernin